jgi:hypothetical protein
VVVPPLEKIEGDFDFTLARIAAEGIFIEGFDLAGRIAAGGVGFRTFQMTAAVRHIRVTRGDVSEDLPLEYSQPKRLTSTAPADRALAELCKLILNLNEFMYVD